MGFVVESFMFIYPYSQDIIDNPKAVSEIDSNKTPLA